MLLEERLRGIISPDDQLCCTQASQGERVAGEGYHPVDVSSFCLLRLSSILVYFSDLRVHPVDVSSFCLLRLSSILVYF